jgi:hypothetical protein
MKTECIVKNVFNCDNCGSEVKSEHVLPGAPIQICDNCADLVRKGKITFENFMRGMFDSSIKKPIAIDGAHYDRREV